MRLLLAEDNHELAHWLSRALTARGAVEERIGGLNAGADDYLAKPFDLGELDARLRALLRRSESGGSELRLGRLILHPDGYFLLADTRLALTPRELALLTALMYRHGRPVAKGQLFEQVFNLDDEAGLDSIDLYIHRLRKKLVGSGVVITTLRGLGYLLEAAPEVPH